MACFPENWGRNNRNKIRTAKQIHHGMFTIVEDLTYLKKKHDCIHGTAPDCAIIYNYLPSQSGRVGRGVSVPLIALPSLSTQ